MGSGHNINSNNDIKEVIEETKLTDMILLMNVEMDKAKSQKIKSKRNLFKLTLMKGKKQAKLSITPSKATLLMRKTNKCFLEESEETVISNGNFKKSNILFLTPTKKEKSKCFISYEKCRMCNIDCSSTKEDTLY